MRAEFFQKVESDLQKALDADVYKEELMMPWRAGDEREEIRELMEEVILSRLGVEHRLPVRRHDAALGKRNPEIEAFFAKVGADLERSANKAAYTGMTDSISIPCITQFDDPAMYYSILFHELAHWTGHPSRTGRIHMDSKGRIDFRGPKAAKAYYVEEELIAEMCATYLSAHFGLPTGDRHASYLNHWRQHESPDVLARAKVKAREAFEYLLEKAGMKA